MWKQDTIIRKNDQGSLAQNFSVNIISINQKHHCLLASYFLMDIEVKCAWKNGMTAAGLGYLSNKINNKIKMTEVAEVARRQGGRLSER